MVAAFYEEGRRCTELFPQTGAPAVLRKWKFILYALDAAGRTASLVETMSEDLPGKEPLMMFHVGSHTLDYVKQGLKDGVFSYPAGDRGGLSNYPQAEAGGGQEEQQPL